MSTFELKLPGTGGLLRRGIARFVAECAEGLARHAASLALAQGR